MDFENGRVSVPKRLAWDLQCEGILDIAARSSGIWTSPVVPDPCQEALDKMLFKYVLGCVIMT